MPSRRKNPGDYDEIGYWSEIKLAIQREYAVPYTQIVRGRRFRCIYIDAFAGAGHHWSLTKGAFVPGSPSNALNVTPGFDEFHFIDLDRARAAELRRLTEGRDDVHVWDGDCNTVLPEEVFPRCRYEDYARALCLLDPYKLGVDWRVLETAGRMKSIEIFYSFMIMDANRNVLWRNPERVSEAQRLRMDRVWPDRRSWLDAAYTKSPGLFGEIEEKTGNEDIVRAFQTCLRDVAGFRYVPEALPMRNRHGVVIYYLVFASPNQTGAKIVSQIYDKFRRRGAR